MDKFAALLENISFFELISLADTVYGPYTSKETGRKIVIIKYDDGRSRTVSYPKYLLEQHLGKELPIEATVDHIDRDFNNNSIDNLRVMDRSDHSCADTRRVKLVRFNCSLCAKPFERSPRLVRDKAKKGRRGIFCSKQCAGRYARKLQLGQIEKFPVQQHIESEYYRNIKSSFDYLLNKYGA